MHIIKRKNPAILYLPFLLVFIFLSLADLKSQTIYSEPALPVQGDAVTIFFNAEGTDLEDYTGDIYTHSGVHIENVGQWQYVIGDWGDNEAQPQLNKLEDNLYEFVITPSIEEFYGVPSSQTVTDIAMVFRSADGSTQTSDLFLSVFQAGLGVSVTHPPKDQPIIQPGEIINISAVSNESTSLSLFLNDEELASTTETELTTPLDASDYASGAYWIIAKAEDAASEIYDSTYVFIRSEPEVEALPQGVIPGVNYIDDNTATLVLHDPPAMKDYVFVIGDFNDWMVSEEGYMKRTPDGKHYWITLSGLTTGEEYGYQYFIDNELRLADPYAHKILDPWNDQYITDFTYPGLKSYPEGKTQGVVSVLQTAQEEYVWQTENFNPPAQEDLVIYELLVRDFVETSAIKTVMDSLDYLQNLGVNAIELMPFNEFEGNISWGYNPAFYFATDKAYGTEEDYKKFIDECHSRGIAVIMDIVLNHSFNLSPFVQMYFDPDAGSWGKPTPENPWFLTDCPHEPWCWGNTFDQNSDYTHELFNRILSHWIEEFRIDGFRFDFTKGFTNQQTGGQGWDYDADRINNLKRIYNHVKSVNPDAYVILEHFTDNTEEKELADYGMMIWGNTTHSYQEASMGWLSGSNFDWASYTTRGWEHPNLISYMESHDEERMMYRNLNFGNEVEGYSVKNIITALERAELAAAFYFTIPGPKMIWQFGELGYDFSINHCQNGTIDEGCRTDPKPIRWDYYDEFYRKKLYNVYSLLANLKTDYDVFRTRDFNLDLGGAVKKIHLNHASKNITLVGNFDVVEQTIIPGFQSTGMWYEYFSRETLNVTDPTSSITLQPGEYRLYSSVEFPDHGLALSSDGNMNNSADNITITPNPSNSGFTFVLDQKSDFNVQIINVKGQVVYQKANAVTSENNSWYWDAADNQGNRLPSGIYFYNLSAGNQQINGKIMIR